MTDPQFQQLMLVLGQIGNTAYQAALQQVYVDAHLKLFWGYVFLVLTLLGVIIVILGFKEFERASKRVKTYASDDDMGAGISVVGFGIIFVTFILAAMNFSDAYTMLLSPQWQAIQLMAHLVVK